MLPCGVAGLDVWGSVPGRPLPDAKIWTNSTLLFHIRDPDLTLTTQHLPKLYRKQLNGWSVPRTPLRPRTRPMILEFILIERDRARARAGCGGPWRVIRPACNSACSALGSVSLGPGIDMLRPDAYHPVGSLVRETRNPTSILQPWTRHAHPELQIRTADFVEFDGARTDKGHGIDLARFSVSLL